VYNKFLKIWDIMRMLFIRNENNKNKISVIIEISCNKISYKDLIIDKIEKITDIVTMPSIISQYYGSLYHH